MTSVSLLSANEAPSYEVSFQLEIACLFYWLTGTHIAVPSLTDFRKSLSEWLNLVVKDPSSPPPRLSHFACPHGSSLPMRYHSACPADACGSIFHGNNACPWTVGLPAPAWIPSRRTSQRDHGWTPQGNPRASRLHPNVSQRRCRLEIVVSIV